MHVVKVSPHVPAHVPGAAGVCARLLGWGRGDICMRACSANAVSAAAPTSGPPSPRVPMHGCGGEVVGRWWGDRGEVVGDGGEMAGMWQGDGGEMAGRWQGGGREMAGIRRQRRGPAKLGSRGKGPGTLGSRGEDLPY